jgi:hypothetical protein
MKVAISQPTFLPWAGYFALIDYVDEFIFLDNVQFTKRSWMQRNKIKSNDKELYLTIPVNSKKKYLQKIKDVEIDYNHFKKNKILTSIKMSYSKSEFFNKYFGIVEKVFDKKNIKLVDLNISLITEISNAINIKTPKLILSNLDNNFSEINTNLLKKICQLRKCDEYISTIGAKNYMGDINKFEDTKINISFFEFFYSEYKQIGQKFITHLSILDLLFNEGPNTINILRKNFKLANLVL